jgi:hypothetical protein
MPSAPTPPPNPHGPYGWGNGPKPKSKTLLGKLIDKIERIQKGKSA